MPAQEGKTNAPGTGGGHRSGQWDNVNKADKGGQCNNTEVGAGGSQRGGSRDPLAVLGST